MLERDKNYGDFMDSKRKKHLLRILADANINNPEYFIEQEDRYKTPMLEKAVFMREVWRPVIRDGDTSWIDNTIADLESRKCRNDLYALRFLPEKPDLLSALHHVKNSDLEPAALSEIVRNAQMSVLGWIISILDGGHCFDDGLGSDWSLCGDDKNGEPTERFGDMKEMVWMFDPDRKDE